ncbi:MAG: TIR domain-containing protein [Chloroflexota bacterium]
MNNSVFISYRRSVSAFIARAVFQDLRASNIDVFMDVESIDAGQFDRIILNQIAARPYFVLILTPGTLDRCVNSEDWLRREIEEALRLKRMIIPLVTPEFKFDDAQKFLNPTLADELDAFNAVSVPHDYFEAAMDKLRSRFLRPVDLPVTPAPQTDESVVRRKLEQVAVTPQVTTQQLNAQSYFERALARPKDDLDSIIADYSEAIRLNLTYGEAYRNRGLARARTGDESGALADINQATRLDSMLTQANLSQQQSAISGFQQIAAQTAKPLKSLYGYLGTLILVEGGAKE